MILNDPMEIIEKVKNKMSNIIIENKIKYLDINLDDLFNIYSADLCTILLNYFPGATIMMHKNYSSCAIMIQGIVYTSNGVVNKEDYFIAGQEELSIIKKSFNQLSEYIIELLYKELKEEIKNNEDLSYTLRKNCQNI